MPSVVRRVPVALLLAFPVVARAQTGAIIGYVVDSLERPVADAEVLVMGSRATARATAGGAYRLERVPAGVALVRVRKLGFHPASLFVEVADDGTSIRDVVLRRLTPTLQRVIVQERNGDFRSPALTQFLARRQGQAGWFLGPAEIARGRPTRVSDLFRDVPGVRVGESDFRVVITSSRGDTSRDGGCGQIPIYVNGVLTPGLFVDDLTVDEIAAIEVYRGPAEVPPGLHGDRGACGAIVIWTR